MTPDLFPYQERGARWLTQRKKFGLLADVPGLGKSAQVIRAADLLNLENILVLAPAVAVVHWTREFSKFSRRSLNVQPVMSAADATKLPKSGVTVCSLSLAAKASVNSLLCSKPWQLCVLDEVHLLKEPTAYRTKAVLGRGGAVHKADTTWLLSGTPAPNHPGEVWTWMYVFGQTELSYEDFLARYCQVIERWARGRKIKTVAGGQNIAELRDTMAPIMLRRRKSEVLTDLPPILYSHVVVPPTLPDPKVWGTPPDGAEWALAQEYAAFATHTDSISPNPVVKSVRRWTGLEKAPAVIETVAEELESNAYRKIVLFAVHRDVLHMLHTGLRKFKPVILYGDTPAGKRSAVVDKFQTDPETRVFIGQTVAAGIAIDLTAAAEVGMVECDWTPGNNAQAIMRCHRVTQNRRVRVRYFSTPGFDERIQNVLTRKTRTLIQLFDD